MSSRPAIRPYQVITNGDMTTTITSKVTVIDNLTLVSYSYTWSGTSPVGTITVQVSNDYKQNAQGGVLNAGTWNTLPLSSSASVTGNNGAGFADIDANAGYALRTIYTPASGSGTLNAYVVGKVS